MTFGSDVRGLLEPFGQARNLVVTVAQDASGAILAAFAPGSVVATTPAAQSEPVRHVGTKRKAYLDKLRLARMKACGAVTKDRTAERNGLVHHVEAASKDNQRTGHPVTNQPPLRGGSQSCAARKGVDGTAKQRLDCAAKVEWRGPALAQSLGVQRDVKDMGCAAFTILVPIDLTRNDCDGGRISDANMPARKPKTSKHSAKFPPEIADEIGTAKPRVTTLGLRLFQRNETIKHLPALGQLRQRDPTLRTGADIVPPLPFIFRPGKTGKGRRQHHSATMPKFSPSCERIAAT